MIEKNAGIEISTTGNGFMVRLSRFQTYDNAVVYPYSELLVFQSYAELENFLKNHFDFRYSHFINDSK